MPRYQVVGYLVTPYSVEIYADSPENAEDLGVEALYSDLGEAGEPEFQPEFEVNEIVELGN